MNPVTLDRGRRAVRRGDRQGRPRVYHPPEPWPCDFDPPAFPYPPGQWPEALRRAWRLWAEAWDDTAAGMELESAGLLWAAYDLMRTAGVEFDPRFSEAFEAWRERAAGTEDEPPDPDDDDYGTTA
ncbi:MAG: hypothetical protein AAF593_00290 [Planctomycetota bacterium]